MSLKPDPNLPNDGLSIQEKPTTAREKRAIRKARKSWIPPALMVKRPDLPTRVPTTCVVCGKAGVPRSLHPREELDFMRAYPAKDEDGKDKPRPPYYGACPEHEEIIRKIAADNEPTPEERFILECCRRAGVDSMTLLSDEVRVVQGNRLRKMRKDAKKSHARAAALGWAKERYPRATWKELAKMAGYRRWETAKKAYQRALQGGTKAEK